MKKEVNEHTPGSWSVSYDEGEGNWRIETTGKCIAMNNMDEVDSGNMTAQESNANAKLIAAAPKLLKALIEARDELAKWKMCEDKNGGDKDLDRVVKLANKALQVH